jgi:outer membrane protein
MLTVRPLSLLLVLATVLLSPTTFAAQERPESPPQGFLYGVGVGINQEIYQGYKRRVIPLPLIGYRGEKLSVYGPFVSYQLLQAGNLSFSAKLAPRFAGFDDSDSDVFIGMAKRKTSLDAGVGLQYQLAAWTVEAETLADVLGNSNGYESKIKLSYGLRFGPLQLSPSVGASYLSDKLVDYYYGVRPEEATLNRAAYQADSTVNYHTGLALSTPILFGGMTRLAIEHHWYGSSIGDSPLTDRDTGFSVILSWSRFF